MMSHSVGQFGDKFRKARESKDLSFDDISNVTKISSRMLQAIENERFDLLPGGVFNKGFIRAYAKHLGLNDEEAISDYLVCLRQAQVDAQQVWNSTSPTPPQKKPVSPIPAATAPPKPAPEPIKHPLPYDKPAATPLPPIRVEPEDEFPASPEPRPAASELSFLGLSTPEAGSLEMGSPVTRSSKIGSPEIGPDGSSPPAPPKLPWNLMLAAVVVLVLAAFLLIRRSVFGNHLPFAGRQSTVSAPAATVAPPPSPIKPDSALRASPVTSKPATPSSAPATTSLASTSQPAVAQPVPASAIPTTTRPETTPVTKPSQPAKDPNIIVRGDVTIRTFPHTPPPSTQPTATSLSLIIRATENCWISVTSDGQLAAQETLIAPAATSFHATRQIVVHLGNAAGVSFLFNGKELTAQGPEGQPQTVTFDAQGMHATP